MIKSNIHKIKFIGIILLFLVSLASFTLCMFLEEDSVGILVFGFIFWFFIASFYGVLIFDNVIKKDKQLLKKFRLVFSIILITYIAINLVVKFIWF